MKPVKLKDVKRERRGANQDRKAIEQGELLVFAGRPAPSETGTLSLRDSSGIQVVVREEDIGHVHLLNGWEGAQPSGTISPSRAVAQLG